MELISLEELKNEYILYIAGKKENIQAYNNSPLGIDSVIIDIMDNENLHFLELLHQLDGIAYGDKSLAMPKWVMLDCGLLPSVFIGLSKKFSDVDACILNKFRIPEGYDGLVPLTEFCALPTPYYNHDKSMIAHTLASIDKGLGCPTKMLGLIIYNAKKIFGIAQYDNPSVRLHSKIAPLKIIHNNYSFHTMKNTFIYESIILPQKLYDMMNGDHVLLEDFDNLYSVEEIKKLKNFRTHKDLFIVYPGQINDNGKIYIPVKNDL